MKNLFNHQEGFVPFDAAFTSVSSETTVPPQGFGLWLQTFKLHTENKHLKLS